MRAGGVRVRAKGEGKPSHPQTPDMRRSSPLTPALKERALSPLPQAGEGSGVRARCRGEGRRSEGEGRRVRGEGRRVRGEGEGRKSKAESRIFRLRR